jgi:Na+/melibiose symporter-like transporter
LDGRGEFTTKDTKGTKKTVFFVPFVSFVVNAFMLTFLRNHSLTQWIIISMVIGVLAGLATCVMARWEGEFDDLAGEEPPVASDAHAPGDEPQAAEPVKKP